MYRRPCFLRSVYGLNFLPLPKYLQSTTDPRPEQVGSPGSSHSPTGSTVQMYWQGLHHHKQTPYKHNWWPGSDLYRYNWWYCSCRPQPRLYTPYNRQPRHHLHRSMHPSSTRLRLNCWHCLLSFLAPWARPYQHHRHRHYFPISQPHELSASCGHLPVS